MAKMYEKYQFDTSSGQKHRNITSKVHIKISRENMIKVVANQNKYLPYNHFPFKEEPTCHS